MLPRNDRQTDTYDDVDNIEYISLFIFFQKPSKQKSMSAIGPLQILILLIVGVLAGIGIRSYRRKKAARLEEMKKAAFNEGRLEELEKKGE